MVETLHKLRPLDGGLHRVAGETQYYMTVFSSQRRINWPRYAHSFAAFTQVRPRENRARPSESDTFVISWLPRTLDICLWRCPEEGRNLSLAETIDWTRTLRTRVSAWGPYRIDSQLFEMAQRRYRELEQGKLGYVAIDNYFRPHAATNCIHALSDLGLTPGLLRTGIAYGDRASVRIARYFEPWILEPARTHGSLTEMMGLNRYDILYRSPA